MSGKNEKPTIQLQAISEEISDLEQTLDTDSLVRTASLDEGDFVAPNSIKRKLKEVEQYQISGESGIESIEEELTDVSDAEISKMLKEFAYTSKDAIDPNNTGAYLSDILGMSDSYVGYSGVVYDKFNNYVPNMQMSWRDDHARLIYVMAKYQSPVRVEGSISMNNNFKLDRYNRDLRNTQKNIDKMSSEKILCSNLLDIIEDKFNKSEVEIPVMRNITYANIDNSNYEDDNEVQKLVQTENVGQPQLIPIEISNEKDEEVDVNLAQATKDIVLEEVMPQSEPKPQKQVQPEPQPEHEPEPEVQEPPKVTLQPIETQLEERPKEISKPIQLETLVQEEVVTPVKKYKKEDIYEDIELNRASDMEFDFMNEISKTYSLDKINLQAKIQNNETL